MRKARSSREPGQDVAPPRVGVLSGTRLAGDPTPRARAGEVLELHWPALAVGAACAGLAAANVVSGDPLACGAVALAGLAAIALLDGWARFLALALALGAIGLWWGSLRMEALERTELAARLGESGSARVVVTGVARRSDWGSRVLVEVLRFRGKEARERALLTLPVGRSPPRRGAIADCAVRLAEPRGEERGFDERAWLARQGAHVVLRARGCAERGRRGGIAGLGDLLRDRIELAVSRGTDGDRRAIVLGVVLGEDEGLPRDLRDAFRASGLAHLLAVSGQNVAFIAGGVLGLGWLVRAPRIAVEMATLAAIAAYVLAVGWQPSVIRAGVAGALVSLAWLVARPYERWHVLALGALVLLAWTPTTLLEPGFQLSFAAVVAIFLGVPRARQLVEGTPLPSVVADVVTVSLVCGLATAPIVVAHFERAPVYTVPANALAFPAVPWVLGLGLLAAALDPLAPGGAAALAWLTGWGAAWLEVVARATASLPGAEVGRRAAVLGALLAASALVLARALRSRRAGARPVATLAASAVAAALVAVALGLGERGSSAWSPPTGLRVTVLDVGQGDAVLLETASARVLVDQGPPEADVAEQLLRMGIRSLSALVLTHPERDHVGGAADVLRKLRVGVALDPMLEATGPEREEAIAVARAMGVPIRELRAGAELRAGGLILRALWPRDGGLPSEDPNLNALVLL
ncbi:MAG: ComEC/Rec2 family competence protein, partial [Gaiellaceae bacterium]|nr:ComEC/Rec2 family competence protein [Gaiellaceae bacterium]